MPVAPTGCPRPLRPPRVHTGTRPLGLISLSSPSLTPCPRSANPQASSDNADMIENASCNSNTSISSGITFAISYARLDDSYAADKNNGSFLEWTAIESVAAAEPATVILGLFLSEFTLSAGTIMTAAAPSPMGEASIKLIGVATILDFSN